MVECHDGDAIDVIAFGDEEGRFPTTLTGSRALAGRFDKAWLDERDAQGVPTIRAASRTASRRGRTPARPVTTSSRFSPSLG